MMQLKYMILNTDEAAEKLLANWQPAPAEIHFFRASSNYVHIFKTEGNWRFIRFARVEERDLATLEAELEFLMYLKDKGYPAAYPVLSKNGKYIETAEDCNGRFFGMVFEKAKGEPLSAQDRTPEQFWAWGKELGSLHNLSRQLQPKTKRRCYLDYLNDFRISFHQWGEQDALAELDLLQAALGQLEQNNENYGLIHYDFQYDNTFWNEEENTFTAIDFDDAHYHFYAMDLIYAMEDLDDEGPEDPEGCIEAFYSGYRSVSSLDDSVMAQKQLFERYANLMHFWRITRSLQDSNFGHEPDWLTRLRPNLLKRCAELRQGFKLDVQSI